MNMKYTILVNSCDSFEDCWAPFFTLFERKWKSCRAPILLNTEFKSFTYDGLSIKSSRVHQFTNNRRLTWSECLIRALEMVDTPLVLYMQEDYFLKNHVKADVIDDFSELMMQDIGIKHIGLTGFGSEPPFKQFKGDERLWVVGQKSKYRISTQAGLWDRDSLLSYLRSEENGWMFEIFGTIRAQKKKGLFLTVNREKYNSDKKAIIDYIHTGIIKGKWNPEIQSVFSQNQIVVDYKSRGFYKRKSYIFRKLEILNKLARNPLKFFKGILGC